MSYDISYDEKEGIVNIHFYGIDTKDDHYSALNEACQLCLENNCKKLLVDLREVDIKPTMRTAFGCFQFGESVSKKMLGFKIAHVLPEIESEVSDIMFISNVEFNRGVNSKEFNNLEDAKKWLN
jgi:hypothetical protein